MLIAIINKSTLVSNAEVQIMTAAIQIQLDLHFLPAWNLKTATVQFYSNVKNIPGYAWVVSILDNATQAGALGYHEENNDTINAFIFAEPVLSNGGAILQFDPVNSTQYTVSATLSHEILEMVKDTYTNSFCVGPQVPAGNLYCLEVCDPVESLSYSVVVDGYQVSVSNFIYPSWINPDATLAKNAPFDYLKQLSSPFTMASGGYIIIATFNNEGQLTAKHVFDSKVPQWKMDLVKGEFYRR